MLEWLQDYVTNVATHLVSIPLKYDDKFYVVYLATFVLLAYFSYRRYYRKKHPAFFRFLFPRSIYLHRSARLDYGIYLINTLLTPLISLAVVGLQTAVAIKVGDYLIKLNSGEPVFVGTWNGTTYAVFIIGFTLVSDFSVYLFHRLHHQSAVLWPIHALHHSAEVMTPFTLFRKHPLWNVSAIAFSNLLTGFFQGIFLFCFYGSPGFEILFGLNTFYVIYNFFGANLRHSHVWLSWGKPLSHLFISPAMHQVHHDPKRMNKNYGEIFAIWDWLFGTLYVPESKETFAIGLGQDQRNPHDSIAKAYAVPLIEMAVQLKQKLRPETRR